MTTLRPLLFIAYGDAGGAWLRRLAAACARRPRLAPLAAARAVQFWWVGGRPPASHSDALASVPPGVEPARLRTLLDAGRSARNRAAFGRLELHTVLVFERWSVFDEAAAHRIALRTALDTARRVDCESGRDAEFDFDWLSLVDCTRASARPADAAVERARRLLASDALPDRLLLIDRVDAAGATVDREMADQCFLALALALGESEHAFPRDGATDAGRSLVLGAEPEPGAAVPIAVLALHHHVSDIERVVAERRRRQLLSPPLQAEPAAAPWQDLAALAEREAEELAAGRASPREARLRRTAAAEALLAAAFTRRDGVLDALGAVEHARATARARFGAVHAGAYAAGSPAPVAARGIAEPRLLMPPAADAPPPPLRALWRRLFAGRPAPWRAAARAEPLMAPDALPDHRARDVAPESVAAHDPPRGPGADAARVDAARQWAELCAALAAVLERWRDAALESKRAAAAAGHVWERAQASPWDWRLAHHPAAPAAAAAPNEYAALAAECLRLALDGAPSAALLEAAVREVVRRELARSTVAAADVIRAALEEPHAAPLRAAVRDSALLANAGRRVPVAEVLWLAPADPAITAALARLEPAETRPRVRFLACDEAGRSVRVAFGEPLRWGDVLSLSILDAP